VAFVSNIALIHGPFIYSPLMLLQISLYGLGILGLLGPKMQDMIFIRVPAYFLAVNTSILFAWWRYLSGQRIITWTPTIR